MLRQTRHFVSSLRVVALILLVTFGFVSVIGTGGGGSGGGSSGPVLLEGAWSGSRTFTVYICIIFACVPDHEQTESALAIASDKGKIHLMKGNVVNSTSPATLISYQFAGRAQVSGSGISGKLRGTCDPLDGPPVFGHIAVDGSVAGRVALDINYVVDECLGRGIFNLDFDTASEKSASLTKVKGQWSDTNVFLNVGNDGAYTGATGSGCQLSGQITPASSEVNVYEISTTVKNCISTNGSYSGLATILPDQFGTETLVVSGLGSSRTITIVVRR